jgi:hypothetical protein
VTSKYVLLGQLVIQTNKPKQTQFKPKQTQPVVSSSNLFQTPLFTAKKDFYLEIERAYPDRLQIHKTTSLTVAIISQIWYLRMMKDLIVKRQYSLIIRIPESGNGEGDRLWSIY